ncbi:MAG: DUF2834 domain-containing protein [Burkholderiaceae bacterium]
MNTTTSAPVRTLLLLLALAGLVAPWWFNLAYLGAGGSLAPGAFFGAAFANPLTTAITIDVYLAALAFCFGVALDTAAGPRRWWVLPLTFGVGLAFTLPLYLWWRSGPSRR